jgi:hypothetical protein
MLAKNDKLVIDFDGVICNSIKECFYVAYLIYYKKKSFLDYKIFFKKKKSQLKNLRVFVRSGFDYYVCIYSIDQKIFLSNIEDFVKLKKKLVNRDIITKLFYSQRRKLMKENFNLWISLNPLYPYIANFLKKNLNSKIYILTNKDKNSVLAILNYNKIFFARQKIYSVSGLETKNDYLYKLQKKKLDVKIYFIEDNIENLLDIKITNVIRYLAGWGYNSINEKNLAKKNNIRILSLSNLNSSFN